MSLRKVCQSSDILFCLFLTRKLSVPFLEYSCLFAVYWRASIMDNDKYSVVTLLWLAKTGLFSAFFQGHSWSGAAMFVSRVLSSDRGSIKLLGASGLTYFSFHPHKIFHENFDINSIITLPFIEFCFALLTLREMRLKILTNLDILFIRSPCSTELPRIQMFIVCILVQLV